jgi:hypothetical protein
MNEKFNEQQLMLIEIWMKNVGLRKNFFPPPPPPPCLPTILGKEILISGWNVTTNKLKYKNYKFKTNIMNIYNDNTPVLQQGQCFQYICVLMKHISSTCQYD